MTPKFKPGDIIFAQNYKRDVEIESIINSGTSDKIIYRFKLIGSDSTGSCFEDDLIATPEVIKKDEKETKGACAKTGSLRYNDDKPAMSHLAPEFLLDMADLMSVSAKKYSKWNYAKGQPYTVPYDSMMRHAHAFMAGEDNDPESKKSHLVHIAANAMIMWTTMKYQIENYPELDDRFKKVLGIEG